MNEAWDDDLSKCITITAAKPAANGVAAVPASYTATNGAGRRLLTITNKQKNEFFISLVGGFSAFDSLIPSNLEMFIRLYLTTPEKYFTIPTASSLRPKFKITQANLIVEFILLRPNLLQAMETRLARSFLQLNFLAKFVKSYSIETGILEKTISITCRDVFSSMILFLQDNITHCGSYKKNYYRLVGTVVM